MKFISWYLMGIEIEQCHKLIRDWYDNWDIIYDNFRG